MKIARFSVAGGDPRFGILDGDDYVVLTGDPMFSGFETTGERVPAAQAKLLAPVIPRSKVVGVTADGIVYLKPNTAVVGPGDAIRLPPVGRVTGAGVLGIVVGSIAKRVPAADAAGVIFGYTVGIDVTAAGELAAGQWATAKGYDTFAPLGPVIETEFDPSDRIASVVERVSDVWTLLPGDVIFVDLPAVPVTLVAGSPMTVEIDGVGRLTNPVHARG